MNFHWMKMYLYYKKIVWCRRTEIFSFEFFIICKFPEICVTKWGN